MAVRTRLNPLQQARADVRSQRAAVRRVEAAAANAERLSRGVANPWLQGIRDHLADERAALVAFRATLADLEGAE